MTEKKPIKFSKNVDSVKRVSSLKPIVLGEKRRTLIEQAHQDNLKKFWEELNGTA